MHQTLDAGLVGAMSIVNATSAAASAVKAISITTAGIVFGKAVISDFSTVYSFGTHLYKVRQLVQSDMDNYAANAASPADSCVAYANVQKMATKCTIANMQELLDQQVAIPSQAVSSNGPVSSFSAARTQVVQTTRQTSPPISSTVVPVH